MDKDETKRTLELLKQLQEHFMAIRRLEQEIEATPARIATLQRDTEENRTAVAHAEESLKEEQLKNARLEGDLKSNQETLSDKHVQTLNVKTNEQLWAIQKEIAFIEKKISDIELETIETMENIDQFQEQLKQARERFTEHKRDNDRKIAEWEKELEVMKRRLVGEQAAYEGISGEIPDQYTTLLSRIGAGKPDGIAMSEVVAGACQACHFRVRPQVFLEIRLGSAIHQCANCSRILYYRGEAESAAAAS